MQDSVEFPLQENKWLVKQHSNSKTVIYLL